jgi:uncharacterized protein (DUF488 family)
VETLCTIGFTKISLRDFIGRLRSAGVTKVIDIRLRNTSHLAGFAKKEDLEFILQECGIAYEHVPELAPTDGLLDGYRNGKDWDEFSRGFRSLLRKSDVIGSLTRSASGHECVCLLCTEDTADKCHRRLVAEFVQKKRPGLQVEHL